LQVMLPQEYTIVHLLLEEFRIYVKSSKFKYAIIMSHNMS